MLDPEDIFQSRECRGALRFYIWRMLPIVDVVGSKPVFIRIRYRFFAQSCLAETPYFPYSIPVSSECLVHREHVAT